MSLIFNASNSGSNLQTIVWHLSFKSILRYHHELHDFEAKNRNQFHLYPTRIEGARIVLGHNIPELLQEFPAELLHLARIYSINPFTYRLKSHNINPHNSTCSINK